MVEDYRNDTVYFKDGDTIQTETLIWTADVTACVFDGIADESYDRSKAVADLATPNITS